MNAGVAELVAAAWPAERWRDVHVVVAVSGGADSMALLRALMELKAAARGAGRLVAAHVNHGLRDEAQADADWVAGQCRQLGVEVRTAAVDPPTLAESQGEGFEGAARRARYRLLATMAESAGARYVATGHTRDDQVETVLLRLLRGAGLRGLAGIPATRQLAPSVTLVRPLLACDREEARRYLERLGQPFREDASNAERRFARNRVRHELLPLLRREFNAEVDAALGRVGEMAGEAQSVLEALAGELLAACRGPERVAQDGLADRTTLEVAPLAGQREILVCEVLRRCWREAGLAEQAMTRRWWRKLAQFALAADGEPALNLPGGVRATRPERGVLALLRG